MSLPFTLLLDPADPDTMFPPPVQLLVAGNTIQRHQRAAVESASLGHGYGLRLDANNEVHSFPTLDRETLRLGIRDRNGAPMLLQRHQFLPSEGYQHQEGVRNNTTGPHSDRLRNDGIRSRFNCIPLNEDDRIGWRNSFGDASGSTVIMATIVEVPPWALMNDLNACWLGMHAPGGGPASPFTFFVGQGKWRVLHRDSRTLLRSGSPTPRGEYVGEMPITEADIGALWGIVVEAKFDPLVGTFRCWVKRPGKDWYTVAHEDGGWGWGYAPNDPDSRLWYAILHGFYSWKNANSSVAPMNWDTRMLTREQFTGPAALFVDEDVTPKAVGEWIEERLAGRGQTGGGTQPAPELAALEARVTALEDQAAADRAEYARLAESMLKLSGNPTDT